MSNIRVGDLCEIVDYPSFVNERLRQFIGCECTVLAIGLTDSRNPECNIRCEIPGFGAARFKPQELRRKRPKSWDKWITDVSSVDHETDPSTDTRIRRAMRDAV